MFLYKKAASALAVTSNVISMSRVNSFCYHHEDMAVGISSSEPELQSWENKGCHTPISGNEIDMDRICVLPVS